MIQKSNFFLLCCFIVDDLSYAQVVYKSSIIFGTSPIELSIHFFAFKDIPLLTDNCKWTASKNASSEIHVWTNVRHSKLQSHDEMTKRPIYLFSRRCPSTSCRNMLAICLFSLFAFSFFWIIPFMILDTTNFSEGGHR